MAARKSRKKSRKLSAYNRFVAKQMKAGKSMAQAAAQWKRTPYAQTGPIRRKKSSRKQAYLAFSSQKLRSLAKEGITGKRAFKAVGAAWRKKTGKSRK